MDPVSFSLPEIILSDVEEPDCTQSGSLSSSYFHPHDLQLMQEPDIHKLPGMDKPCVRQLILSLKDPFQPRAEDCPPPFLNVLPAGVCPPSLGLQASPTGVGSYPGLTPLFPELMLGPFFPHDPCWPNMSPVTPAPSSKLGLGPHVLVPHVLVPHVLVPIGSPLCCSPCSPRLLLPEVRPDWCMCPQAARGHQPRSRDPVSRGTTSAETGREQLEERAEPEGQRSRVYRKGQGEEEQKNNTLSGAKCKPPPGCLPSSDEESAEGCNFKEYVTIINSLGPKAKENEDEDEEENLTIENISFLEYMDQLCSNEDFVSEVESTLNMEYLDRLLSSDPEPVDLLSLEEQEVLLEEDQPSSDAILNPTTDDTSLVESTMNTEYLDPNLSPDPDPIDLLSHRELLLEIMNMIQQQLAHLSAGDSDSAVTPGPEETAPETSRVEEPAPPVSDPPGSQSDTSPNQDGPRPPPRNTGPREGWTTGSPVLPSHLREAQTDSPADASSSPLDGCLFMDYITSLRLHAKTSPDAGRTLASEARDTGASAETPAAAKPEEARMSLSNLRDTQASQKPQEGPLPGDPPASESPSTPSVSGANEDPCTAAAEAPAPGSRADLPAGPPAPSVLPLKTSSRPLPPTREPLEPRSPGNSNPNSCAEATPEPPNADPRNPPADAISSDSASSETERKEVGEAAREETLPKKASERNKENKESETKLKGTTEARRSQRLSSQTERPCEKGEGKSERGGAVCEKQKSRSSGRRQLFKESHSERRGQTPRRANTAGRSSEIGERERRQKPAGERRKQEAKDPDVSSGTGAGGRAPPTEIPREENESGEGAQKSSFARRTRSTATAEREQPTPLPASKARGEVKRSWVEGKFSPEMGMQDDGTVEVTGREEEALMVLRSRNRRDKTSEDEASPADPPPQSPKVQTDTRPTKDSAKESSGEEPPVEASESPPAKSREIKTSLNETRDFDSLRSQSASRGTGAPRRPATPAGGGINGGEEEAERQSLAETPTERPAHPRANETETISSGTTKGGRSRSGEEKSNVGGAKEAETSGCTRSPPSTRSSVKAEDGKASKASSGQEAPEGDATGTGTGRGPRFSSRLSKLPTKYQDFNLRKTNTHSRPPDKEEGKARGGRKR